MIFQKKIPKGEIWNESIEKFTQREIRKKIDRLLLFQSLKYIDKRSDFYAKKIGKGALKKIKTFKDFEKISFTTKKEILQNQREFPPFGSYLCVSDEEIKRVHCTSGTSGVPLIIALSENDIILNSETGARCFWASGLRPWDKVVHCLSFNMWAGGLTDNLSLERTGAAVVPFGVGNSKKLIETIKLLKSNALSCTPSYLNRLESILNEEFDMLPSDLGLTKGFMGGEGGFEDMQVRQIYEKKWAMKIMNANYGLSDILSMFGAECEKRDGLHFMGQGALYAEIIDPNSKRSISIEKGSTGELVLTSLNKKAQPLIRFRTGDIIKIIDHNKCKCGRGSFRFALKGRNDDMLNIKGINFFTGSLPTVFKKFKSNITGEYVVVLRKPGMLEEVEIEIECYGKILSSKKKENRLKEQISRSIKDSLGVKSQIIFVPEGYLGRSEGKTKRIKKFY